MQQRSLPALARERLAAARASRSGRSAYVVYGGPDHVLRQTLVALLGGRALDEHDSPGDATLQVLQGRVQLVAGDAYWEGRPGDQVDIPPVRHSLLAFEDSVVLLTVGLRAAPAGAAEGILDMYRTDGGLDALVQRRGADQVTVTWLAARLRDFADQRPECAVAVDRLADWLARSDEPTTPRAGQP